MADMADKLTKSLNSEEIDEEPVKDNSLYTVEEAIQKIGYGYFQAVITIFYGCLQLADAIEFMLLSILSSIVKCQWLLSDSEEALITSLVFVGFLIGGFFWGVVVQIVGRKTGLLMVNLVVLSFGILSALKVSPDDGRIPGYPWLLFCRFGVGFGIGGTGQAVTYYTEFLPSKGRGLCLSLAGVCWSLGAIFGALLALGVLGESDLGWHWYLGLASVPLAPTLLLFLVIPESARFYLVKGKYNKAQKVIQKVARFNCKKPPSGQVVSHEEKKRFLDSKLVVDNQQLEASSQNLTTPTIHSNSSTQKSGSVIELTAKSSDTGRLEEKRSLLESESKGYTMYEILMDISSLFTYGMWKTTIILMCVWFGTGWLHYGVVLLTTTLLRSDTHCGFANHNQSYGNDSIGACLSENHLDTADYLRIVWTDSAEIPGVLITVVIIELLGRKCTMAVELVACMVGYLLLFICTSETITTLFLFITHIFTSSIFKTLYIYTAEVYPTNTRSIGLGACVSSARIGAIVTPYVAQVLLHINTYATLSLYAGSCIVFAVLVLLLPIETRGRALRDKATKTVQ